MGASGTHPGGTAAEIVNEVTIAREPISIDAALSHDPNSSQNSTQDETFRELFQREMSNWPQEAPVLGFEVDTSQIAADTVFTTNLLDFVEGLGNPAGDAARTEFAAAIVFSMILRDF